MHPVRKAKWGVSIREQKKGMFNALLYKKYPALYRSRIQSSLPWNYYLIIFGFLITVAGIAIQQSQLTIAGIVLYSIFTVKFILKRLASTSRSIRHIVEMIVTSVAIPFLSVYWSLYGAWKFKVLFA